MTRFNFRYLPELSVKGWTDGNLVTFDHNDPDTLQTLDYIGSAEDYIAEMGMERLIETILNMWQIKQNKKTVKKILAEDNTDGLSRDIYDNWNIK